MKFLLDVPFFIGNAVILGIIANLGILSLVLTLRDFEGFKVRKIYPAAWFLAALIGGVLFVNYSRLIPVVDKRFLNLLEPLLLMVGSFFVPEPVDRKMVKKEKTYFYVLMAAILILIEYWPL